MPRTVKIDPQVQVVARSTVMTIIRVNMVGSRVGFRELAERLNEAGIEENERNLRNKVARGEMQASFFLMCLRLLGCDKIPLEGLPLFRSDIRREPKN
jgi:hypothetical protein